MQVAGSSSMHTSLRFSGRRATRQAQQRLLQPDELKRCIEQDCRKDDDPYVGKPPASLSRALKLNARETLEFLELAVVYIRFPGIDQELHNELEDYKKRAGLTNFQLSHVDEGTYGEVYRLVVNDEQYALKLHHERDKSENWHEIINGAYFTARPTRDTAAMYVANARSGWLLSEFIDENTELSGRPGQTIAEQGYVYTDEANRNRINGILVDLGAAMKRIPKPTGSNRFQADTFRFSR